MFNFFKRSKKDDSSKPLIKMFKSEQDIENEKHEKAYDQLSKLIESKAQMVSDLCYYFEEHLEMLFEKVRMDVGPDIDPKMDAKHDHNVYYKLHIVGDIHLYLERPSAWGSFFYGHIVIDDKVKAEIRFNQAQSWTKNDKKSKSSMRNFYLSMIDVTPMAETWTKESWLVRVSNHLGTNNSINIWHHSIGHSAAKCTSQGLSNLYEIIRLVLNKLDLTVYRMIDKDRRFTELPNNYFNHKTSYLKISHFLENTKTT